MHLLNFHNITLQKRIIFLIVFFLICNICIIIWVSSSYIKLQTDSIQEYLSLYSSHFFESTAQEYNSFENIAYSIAYNNTLQDYIEDTETNSRYDSYKKAYNLLSNSIKLNSNIADIAVISDSGNSVSLYTSPDMYKELKDDFKYSNHAFSSVGTLTINNTLCQVLSMPIYHLLNNGKNTYLGSVYVSIDLNRLLLPQKNDDVKNTPEILLTDSNGSLIYGSSNMYAQIQSDYGSKPSDWIIKSNQIYTPSLKQYIIFDRSESEKPAISISLKYAVYITAVLSLLLIIFIAVWRPVYKSLHKLETTMERISQGEYTALKDGISYSEKELGCREISDVYTAFNAMLSEIDKLNHTIFNTYTQMYELEMNNKATEIAFLRSQINPHFLYNTLATICGLSSAGKNEEVNNVANALSKILRYSIKGGDMVELSKEYEIIQNYLTIQKCRFEDRFSVEYHIEDSTLDVSIPKMIIQPLVENAIVHGIEPSLKPGKIIVSAKINKQHHILIISIMDTGVGMSSEKLSSLQKSLFDSDMHDSIGLANVNSRLILYYGHNYGLKIKSWEGYGTEITVHIPLKDTIQEVRNV